jgi:hypothetical protein
MPHVRAVALHSVLMAVLSKAHGIGCFLHRAKQKLPNQSKPNFF